MHVSQRLACGSMATTPAVLLHVTPLILPVTGMLDVLSRSYSLSVIKVNRVRKSAFRTLFYKQARA